MDLDASGAVKLGAAWLDVRKPGWFDLVDLAVLNMDDTDSCVAGQVFASEAERGMLPDGYWYARQILWEESPKEDAYSPVCRYGFVPTDTELFSDLWTAEIEARRTVSVSV